MAAFRNNTPLAPSAATGLRTQIYFIEVVVEFVVIAVDFVVAGSSAVIAVEIEKSFDSFGLASGQIEQLGWIGSRFELLVEEIVVIVGTFAAVVFVLDLQTPSFLA